MVILASASPRRRELMSVLCEEFTVLPANCDETLNEKLGDRETAEYLSKIKGDALKNSISDGDIVISADTIVAVDGEILGKPKSKDDARKMIKHLSGNTHTVFTGVTLTSTKKQVTFSDSTLVTFYELTDAEIEEYISTDEPYDKAGAYGIQGKGSLLVGKIDGDFYNVMGFPVGKIKRELSKF